MKFLAFDMIILSYNRGGKVAAVAGHARCARNRRFRY
jgi:hypothetical protein